MTSQQGKRYNVQIIDLEGRTRLLLKSILLGSDCRVSISSTISSARAKLETGLFDGAIVDLASKKQMDRIGDMLEEQVPSDRSFPIGSITDHPDVRLSSSELTIERPLRIHQFQKLIRRMKNQMGTRDRIRRLRSSIDCRIQMENQTLPVASVSLNEKGLMARLEQRIEDDEIEVSVPDEEVSVLVSFPDSDVEKELSGSMTFTERGTDDSLTGIGLQFRSGADQLHDKMQTLQDEGAFQTQE